MKNKYYILGKTMTIMLLLSVLWLTMPKAAVSQEQQISYALVEYFKVKPQNIEKYLELEKSFWKPIHEERLAQKEIVRWRLFRVRFTGTDDEYNFVTGTFFNDFDKLDKVFKIDIQKVHPGKDIEKLYQETFESREMVKTNLVVMNSGTNSNTAAKFLQINFMDVKQGDENEYLDVENSVWKPVHQELVNSILKAGWSLWSLVYPSGSGLPYQFLAVDDFADFSQIGKINYTDAFTKVHKGKNSIELFERTNKSRILVRSELWESMDAVFAK